MSHIIIMYISYNSIFQRVHLGYYFAYCIKLNILSFFIWIKHRGKIWVCVVLYKTRCNWCPISIYSPLLMSIYSVTHSASLPVSISDDNSAYWSIWFWPIISKNPICLFFIPRSLGLSFQSYNHPITNRLWHSIGVVCIICCYRCLTQVNCLHIWMTWDASKMIHFRILFGTT